MLSSMARKTPYSSYLYHYGRAITGNAVNEGSEEVADLIAFALAQFDAAAKQKPKTQKVFNEQMQDMTGSS